MSAGGKGDKRRPGVIPDGAWEAIFNKKKRQCNCLQCGDWTFVCMKGSLPDMDESTCKQDKLIPSSSV